MQFFGHKEGKARETWNLRHTISPSNHRCDRSIASVQRDDTKRLDWLDKHCAFVADSEYCIGPYKIGELRKMADDGIGIDAARGELPKGWEQGGASAGGEFLSFEEFWDIYKMKNLNGPTKEHCHHAWHSRDIEVEAIQNRLGNAVRLLEGILPHAEQGEGVSDDAEAVAVAIRRLLAGLQHQDAPAPVAKKEKDL